MALPRKARTSDTYNLEARLETLIHHHLLDMEENPEMYASKDRLAAIQYIGMFLNRKYGWGEVEAESVGSAVRKYSGAFRITKPENAAGTRAAGARPARISGGLARIGSDDTDTEDTAA